MKPAAIYLRVSTSDQTVENQRAEVEALCRARGFDPVAYEESASSVKQRPVFDRMMADARSGKIRGVFVWALDRLHRSLPRLVADMAELDRVGAPVLSVRESWLDASGPQRSLLICVFGWMGQFERDRLIERTRAGLRRAREEGKTLGRPRAPSGPLALAVEAVEFKRWSASKAARGCGVGATTLRRELVRQGFTPRRGLIGAWEPPQRAKNPT